MAAAMAAAGRAAGPQRQGGCSLQQPATTLPTPMPVPRQRHVYCAAVGVIGSSGGGGVLRRLPRLRAARVAVAVGGAVAAPAGASPWIVTQAGAAAASAAAGAAHGRWRRRAPRLLRVVLAAAAGGGDGEQPAAPQQQQPQPQTPPPAPPPPPEQQQQQQQQQQRQRQPQQQPQPPSWLELAAAALRGTPPSLAAFVLGGAAVGALLLGWARGVPMRRHKPYRFTMAFEKASKLGPGTPVRMKGVQIGSVKAVGLRSDSLEAVAEVADSRNLVPLGSRVDINLQGLAADPWIDITPPRGAHVRRDRGPHHAECGRDGLVVCDGGRIAGSQGGSTDYMMHVWLKQHDRTRVRAPGTLAVPKARGPALDMQRGAAVLPGAHHGGRGHGDGGDAAAAAAAAAAAGTKAAVVARGGAGGGGGGR